MKKVFALSALALLATGAHAQGHIHGTKPALNQSHNTALTDGIEVGLDFGSAKVKVKDHELGRANTQTLRVGTDLGGFRVVGDFTNYGKVKNKTVIKEKVGAIDVDTTIEASTRNYSVSGLYDFANDSAITPYVGARIGALNSKVKSSSVTTVGGTAVAREREKENETKLSYGVIGGVQYNIGQFGIHGAVDYTRSGDINLTGARIGGSYKF